MKARVWGPIILAAVLVVAAGVLLVYGFPDDSEDADEVTTTEERDPSETDEETPGDEEEPDDGLPEEEPGEEPSEDGVPGDEEAVCLEGEPFIGDGEFPLEGADEPGDAREVIDLRWEDHETCERFVIDLGTEEGDPALSPGRVSAEVLRDLGVVRVTLQDVERVDPEATDELFEGSLAQAAYVVSSEAGPWVYVDLHLADEAEAYVETLDDPARVLVDLRPGGGPLPAAPAVEDQVVVLEPRPGEATYPITVTGYARTFEANVVARLEQGGQEVYEDFTTATAWADAWGYYSQTIEEGPEGPVELHVGDYSARDGTWEGAVVELEME